MLALSEEQLTDKIGSKTIRHPPGPQLSYLEYPLYYRWVKEKWQRRVKKGEKRAPKTVVRMHSASPNQGDRWWIRLLLSVNSKGATSFDDLRHKNKSYYETCVDFGLTINPAGNCTVFAQPKLV